MSFLLDSIVVFSQDSNLNDNVLNSLRCQNPMVILMDTIRFENVTWEKTQNPKMKLEEKITNNIDQQYVERIQIPLNGRKKEKKKIISSEQHFRNDKTHKQY